MEMSSFKWMPEVGMDYSNFFPRHQMNGLDSSLDEINFQSFSSETSNKRSAPNIEATHVGVGRPAQELNTNIWNSCTTELSTPKISLPSSSSKIISFENSIPFPAIHQPIYCLDQYSKTPKIVAGSPGNINLPDLPSLGSYPQETNRAASIRGPLQAQDHMIAERKRREKLSQRFVALSALLPGLKKMDQASVLEDAIKYLKQLEERVKMLEEKAARKTMESAIIVKKSYIFSNDGTSSSDYNSDSKINKLHLPQVGIRVSGRDILIRIHCQNYKGCIMNILNEIEKLPLTVVNSNVLSFGNSTLDITVVSQMNIDFAITVKDLVNNLRSSLLKLM